VFLFLAPGETVDIVAYAVLGCALLRVVRALSGGYLILEEALFYLEARGAVAYPNDVIGGASLHYLTHNAPILFGLADMGVVVLSITTHTMNDDAHVNGRQPDGGRSTPPGVCTFRGDHSEKSQPQLRQR